MDVIRAQVVVNLTAQNIEFLREQLRAADDRLNVGEGTRTDVAQTNARLQRAYPTTPRPSPTSTGRSPPTSR